MALIFGHSIDDTNIRAFDRWRERILVYYIVIHRSPHSGDPAIVAALRNNTASRIAIYLYCTAPQTTPPPQQTYSLHSGNPNIAQWIGRNHFDIRPADFLQVDLLLHRRTRRMGEATQERRPSIGTPRLQRFQIQSGLGSRAKNINSI